jgi:hypothetical protein
LKYSRFRETAAGDQFRSALLGRARSGNRELLRHDATRLVPTLPLGQWLQWQLNIDAEFGAFAPPVPSYGPAVIANELKAMILANEQLQASVSNGYTRGLLPRDRKDWYD